MIVTASQFQSTAPIRSISIVQTSFTRSAHRAYAKPSEHDLVQETMGAPRIRSTRAGSAHPLVLDSVDQIHATAGSPQAIPTDRDLV